MMEMSDNSCSPEEIQELFALAWSVRDQAMTPEQAAWLEKLVSKDPAAWEIYLDLMGLIVSLRWNLSSCNESNLTTLFPGCHAESDDSSMTRPTIPGAWPFNARLDRMHDILPLDIPLEGPEETMILPAVREKDVPAFSDESDTLPSPPILPVLARRQRHLRRRLFGLAAAVVIVLACAIVVPLLLRKPTNVASPSPVSTATLVGSAGAVWKGVPPAAGRALATSSALELTAGLVRLKFADADVIVQAPARFVAVSDKRIQLTRGKLWARATSTAGFEVATPSGLVKDLGTEFGVDVQSSTEASVHVFEGQVAVSGGSANGPASSRRVVAANEAVVFDAAGTHYPITSADPLVFVRPDQFAAAVAADVHPLLRDPDVVARLTFAEVDGKLVANPLGRGDGAVLRVLIGDPGDPLTVPLVVPGRREGMLALHFDPNRSDHVEIVGDKPDALDFSRGQDGQASAQPMTVAAWVRAAPRQTAENGACIVIRGLEEKEQYCLDIFRDRFRFYVRDPGRAGYGVNSQVAPDGNWHFVVGTFDLSGGVRLYVDGVRQGQTQGPRNLLPPTDDLRIGSRPGWSTNNEFKFDGAIEEVVIWRRALADAEIATLYSINK
jgi:hypothetical protein